MPIQRPDGIDSSVCSADNDVSANVVISWPEAKQLGESLAWPDQYKRADVSPLGKS